MEYNFNMLTAKCQAGQSELDEKTNVLTAELDTLLRLFAPSLLFVLCSKGFSLLIQLLKKELTDPIKIS